MRRRALLGMVGAAAGWPLLARAQGTPLPVVGFLNSASAESYADALREYLRGLAQAGFVPDRNVAIEYRWAEGNYQRLPDLLADLIRRQVAVIAATSTPAALAAKAATTSIPIVFTTASDPVQIGLVKSLR